MRIQQKSFHSFSDSNTDVGFGCGGEGLAGHQGLPKFIFSVVSRVSLNFITAVTGMLNRLNAYSGHELDLYSSWLSKWEGWFSRRRFFPLTRPLTIVRSHYYYLLTLVMQPDFKIVKPKAGERNNKTSKTEDSKSVADCQKGRLMPGRLQSSKNSDTDSL